MDTPMDTKSGFETVGDVVRWCREAPAGTRLDARTLGELLEGVTAAEGEASEEAPGRSAAELLTWREKLWLVPAETRIGIQELAEALDRAMGWIYKRTSAGEIPHGKLGGALVFTVGEVRHWIRETEVVEVSCPMESTKAERELELMEGGGGGV